MLLRTSLLLSFAALLSNVHCAPAATHKFSLRGFFGSTSRAGACINLGGCEVPGASDEDEDGDTDDSDSLSSSDESASVAAPGPGAAPANPEQLFCSVNTTQTPPAAYANSGVWVGGMNECRNALNVDKWVDNHQCTLPEGPSFKFYSKAENWDSPMNCYAKCGECLTRGIQAHISESTYCRYEAHIPADGSWCEMGFWQN
ncbi:MAG: hypothetical protein Q9216_002422 [Gyalolechia sp. 2 TL-2023]